MTAINIQEVYSERCLAYTGESWLIGSQL